VAKLTVLVASTKGITPRATMPELRSGTVTSLDPVADDPVADPTVCPTLAELIPVVDRASAAEPAGEGLEWLVACVKFKAAEFGKPHADLRTWAWWLRFRAPLGQQLKLSQERAKEIVRSQYSPPMSHQRHCDFCTSKGALADYHYTIHDDNFVAVEIMPTSMHTSDDDYDAKIGPELTIAACARMKVARGAQRSQGKKHAARTSPFWDRGSRAQWARGLAE